MRCMKARRKCINWKINDNTTFRIAEGFFIFAKTEIMNWDFLEIFDVFADVLDLLGNTSASAETGYGQKAPVKKKTKYLTEKISTVLLLFSSVLLFFVFKNPLPTENHTQTLIVGSLIGLAIAMVFFLILYLSEKYYFRNVFQWLFFSSSLVLFCVSIVFCIYFKSGLFI